MNGRMPLRDRAAALMRVALLLDQAGDQAIAAAHLQMSLDTLAGIDPPEPDEVLLCQAALAPNLALMRAKGGALAVLSGVMQGKTIASMEEISSQLGIYAFITSETSPDEGLILACWAGTLRDAAQRRDNGNAPQRGRTTT